MSGLAGMLVRIRERKRAAILPVLRAISEASVKGAKGPSKRDWREAHALNREIEVLDGLIEEFGGNRSAGNEHDVL